MTTTTVEQAGISREQVSALTMSTLAFAVNFAVWVMFSVIGIKIKAELNLNETEFGLLVATPILTGSLMRLPLGILTDRYGGRIVYFLQMLAVVIPTWVLSYATEYWQYLVLGLFIGVAGGSFAVGIAYTSAWFSKERQGTAMGIFGAGNAGSSLTKFIAPLIIAASATASWRTVPQVYAVAMLVMAVLFWFLTSEDPLHRKDAAARRRVPLGEQLKPLLDLRGLALRARLLLRVRRVRGDGAVAAQVLRRRVRAAAGHRRVPHHSLRPALGGDPRAGRVGVGQVGRQHGHLVGAVGQPGLHVPPELPAHDDDRPRDQGRRRGRHRGGARRCSPC